MGWAGHLPNILCLTRNLSAAVAVETPPHWAMPALLHAAVLVQMADFQF